ncbi:MAG: prolipoprotein diacylglyceryl transferase [Bdellovibrionales bacterium]|nr:prolipoprotein diacylglyceryl transferase [Bdellovibrionales bacterium]
MACILGALFFLRRAAQRQLDRVTAIDLTLVCLIAGFLGARLLHVFYEDFFYYRENPVAVLYVWNGGFVFLGGVIAAWLAASIFCNIKREPFWFWADVAAPPIALAYALGRLACFANGCCYGRECLLPWAVTMDGHLRHPAQLYASGWELLLLVFLLKIEPKCRLSGVLFNIWLLGHAVGRLMMEAFRADPRGDLILGFTIGTWMSLVLAAFAGFNLIHALLRPRTQA